MMKSTTTVALLVFPCMLQFTEGAYSYEHLPQGCVNGYNIRLYKDKSVAECKVLCDKVTNCLAFEYGVAYGGNGGYKAKDSQLQRSKSFTDCDGSHHNLDLYIKTTLITSKPTAAPITPAPTSVPTIDQITPLHDRLKDLENLLGSSNTTKQFQQLEQVLETMTTKMQSQDNIISRLQDQMTTANNTINSLKLLVNTDITDELSSIRDEITTIQTEAATGDDGILSKLDSAATLSKTGVAWTSTYTSPNKDPTPNIQAENNDISMLAPAGKAVVVTEQCPNGVDICQLANLASTLKEALAKLGDGNA